MPHACHLTRGAMRDRAPRAAGAAVLLLIVAVAAVPHLARAELECYWYNMPIPNTDALVIQSTQLAVQSMQADGEFTGVVEAYDELFTLMGANATAEVLDGDLIPEAVLCNLDSVNMSMSTTLVTQSCISVSGKAWLSLAGAHTTAVYRSWRAWRG